MFEIFAQPETWISLLALVSMEIVLGVDNIIFISILAGKLPPENRQKARTIGLLMAIGSRLILGSFLKSECNLNQVILLMPPYHPHNYKIP